MLDWISRLRGNSAEQVAQARSMLEGRGFQEREIELALKLVHPDPNVRRALVDDLATVSGIDPRVWLVWLSQDEHPDVRLAALTRMATSRDPQLLERVVEAARLDRDPRITALGQKLSGVVGIK
jgi:hypothetical protein